MSTHEKCEKTPGSTQLPFGGMEAVARSLDVDPSQPPDFAALYASEFNFVWHLARRMGVASRNQPDVVQDVFLTVHRRLGTYDSSRPLRPWVAGVALRVALDHLRLARNTAAALSRVAAQSMGCGAGWPC